MNKSLTDTLAAIQGAITLRIGSPELFKDITHEQEQLFIEADMYIEQVFDSIEEEGDIPMPDQSTVLEAVKKAYENIKDIAPIEAYHLEKVQKHINHACDCPPLKMKEIDNSLYCPKCRQLKLPL